MNDSKTYTLNEIHEILSNLENCISGSERMIRIKLPIPQEYGGGWATGRTQEEAVKNLLKRVSSTQPAIDAPIFSRCWDAWFSIKLGENLSPCTIENYRRLAKQRLLPFFGDIPIDKITADDIQRYFNSIIGLSRSYSIQSKAILKGVFGRAERLGDIQSNPMRFEYVKSSKQSAKVILQDEDFVNVINQLDKLDGKDYLYSCFLCFTALRRGEILGLRWEDIDVDARTITVRHNVIFPDGMNDPIEKGPKDGSFGVVYLQSELLKRIEPYRLSKGRIFSGSHGAISRSSFTKMWYRIRKTLDLKGATSHSFRATYATMMNAHCMHIDPKALQGALRHKTPDLAIKVYTKQNQNKTRMAEEEYDEWLQSQLLQTS